jgi:hypothetical protein
MDQPPLSAPEQAPARRSRASVDTLRGFALELAIVTVGVFIALSVDSLREWNQHRTLVRDARATLAREVADNKADLDKTLGAATEYKRQIANALQLAGDLLTKKESTITQVQLGANLADLTDAGWRSADRTGALGHMDFAEVQRYSRLYELQELFVDHQRRSLDRATAALALLSGGDPHGASPSDLEAFRHQVLGMNGDLIITEQIGKRLSESYAGLLAGQ